MGAAMMHDRLSRLEKGTLLALGAGNAFNILLFAMGLTLSDATGGPWLWVRGAFAVVQFVAFDLTVVATVQAMRDGRRSRWAGLTVAVAALAAILIALDVSTWRMPFVHAAYAVVLPLFMLHLAAVRQGVTHELQGVARRASAAEQEVAELRQALINRQQEVAQAQQMALLLRQEYEQQIVTLRQQLTHTAQQALTDDATTITVAGRRYTTRQIATIFEISESSVRRKLAQIEELPQ